MPALRPEASIALPAPPRGPLLVACHDAGAASLIFAWLGAWLRAGQLQPESLRPALSGPAAALWAADPQLRALPLPPAGSALDGKTLDDVRCVLSGSGWQSDWEHRARLLARARGLPSIAVLDHWVNYPQRFERDGTRCLPDTLWVSDDEAGRIAERLFPGLAVHRLPNLYLHALLTQIAPPDLRHGDILYVLEPARDDWGRGMPGEFQALDFFMSHRERAGLPAERGMRLRLHPSEPVGKYDAWIAAHREHGVMLDDAATLPESLSRAAVVAGLHTMAMAVALAAGRQVVSTLPPWAGPCLLPHSGILALRELA